MATHDYSLANQSGASFRTDLNNALAAIQSNNSNSSSPATTVAYQWWADTTSGTLKIRNSANNAWVELLQLDGTLTLEDGSASTPALAFRDDLNTGIFRSAADTFNVATAGVERMELGTTTIFNEDGADVNFRIEGDTDANLFFVDAGENHIGIGTASPDQKLVVSDTSSVSLIRVIANNAQEAGIDFGDTDDNDIGRIRYSNSDNLMKFFVNAAERMRIDSSGNVGIGTTTADNRLHIESSSNTYLQIEKTGTSSKVYVGNASGGAIVESTGGTVSLKPNSAANKFTLDTSGRMLLGISTARENLGNNTSGVAQQIQLEGTSAITSSMSLIRNSNDGADGGIILGKTRGTSVGSNTVVQAGDDLGALNFVGADGTSLQFGAAITASVESGVGNDDMPACLKFFTNGGSTSMSERMRIDSSGNLLKNTTSTIATGSNSDTGIQLGANNQATFMATGGPAVLIARNGSTGEAVRFGNQGNGDVGSIDVTTSSTSYNTSSDYRLKENATAISDGITRLKTLKPYRFNFIIDPDKTVDGFLAHEVTAVPEAITGTKDEVDSDNNPIYQGIDQSKLVPLLTAALQEAVAKIEVLETKVAVLEAA